MTIESGIENPGVYINSLNDTYPAAGDTMTEGDNHIRGLKNTIQNTFPNVAGVVNSTHTELNYVDVVAIGTVEASKAVVVDANLDALGFRKITATASGGYTANFTYTGTTNDDYAVRGTVTGLTGETYAVGGTNASASGRAVRGISTHATGINYGGYFQSSSSAGFGLQAVSSTLGGVAIRAVAFDAGNANNAIEAVKGSRSIYLNPQALAADYANPIVETNDQVIGSIGTGGAIDTGVIAIAPNATDAVGIRISSVTDSVAMSGTIDATGHRVVAGDTVVYKAIGNGDTSTAEVVYLALTSVHYVQGRCVPFRCLANGTVRIKFEHYTNNTAYTSSARIVKNEVLDIEYTTVLATPVPRVRDIAVAVGDIITVQQKISNALTVTSLQNFTVCAATLSAAVC